MFELFVKDFSEFPGPREEIIGPFSGERFRDEVLVPALKKNPEGDISINLDGTAGYGSSFLEESFGGLVRLGFDEKVMKNLLSRLVSEEDPSLIHEISDYVMEALEAQQGD